MAWYLAAAERAAREIDVVAADPDTLKMKLKVAVFDLWNKVAPIQRHSRRGEAGRFAPKEPA